LYRISFTVKAAEQRTIVSYAGKSVDPWTAYSNYDTFTITDSLKEYSYIFDMKSTDVNSRIVFDLGKSVFGVTISEIKLEELTLKTTSSAYISNDIKIFPNPVKNSFRITNAEGISSVALYNLSGQKVFVTSIENGDEIDASKLEPGVYILNLETGKRNFSYKIVKQ
jgi:endoglucanase